MILVRNFSIKSFLEKVLHAKDCEVQNTCASGFLKHFFYRKKCFTLKNVKHELPSQIRPMTHMYYFS